MRVVLFVKKKFVDQITSGQKRFDIRAGARYRRVSPHDELLINGTQAVVRVKHVAAFPTLRSAAHAHGMTIKELCSIYPRERGPFYAFYFDPPPSNSCRVIEINSRSVAA